MAAVRNASNMLIEFSKSHTSNSFKLPERAMPVNCYQFMHELQRTRALWRKNANNPSAY